MHKEKTNIVPNKSDIPFIHPKATCGHVRRAAGAGAGQQKRLTC